jgi:hypothetical protein
VDNFVRLDENDSFSRMDLGRYGNRLARVLRHSDPGRAAAILETVLHRLAEVTNDPQARRIEINALTASTYPLRQMGRADEARARLDAAFARLSELKLYPAEQIQPGSEADHALRARAEYEAGSRNISKAIETYQHLLDRILASKPEPDSRLIDALRIATVYRAMALLHRRAGMTGLAATLAARDLELWRRWDQKLPNNSFVRRQLELAVKQ